MWDKPQLLNWLANLLYAITVVLGLYAVLFVVVHLPTFPLRHVVVQGNLHHVTRDQIRLITDKHMQGNFFTVDLKKTKDAFEKLPWAREVSVRRRWPDKLEVIVREHHAMARWGNLALVNTQGELFQAAFESELPTFYANGDFVLEVSLNYADFNQALQESGLKIEQLSLSPRHAWKLKVTKYKVKNETENNANKTLPAESVLENSVIKPIEPKDTNIEMAIEMGRDKPLERLKRFVNAYKQGLSKSNLQIAYVDLRYPNGFALMQKGGNQLSNLILVKPNAIKPKSTSIKAIIKVTPSGVKI